MGRRIRRPLQAEDGEYPDSTGGWKRVKRSISEIGITRLDYQFDVGSEEEEKNLGSPI